MNDSLKRRRGGTVVALIGAAMLALWLANHLGMVALPESVGIFLVVVGAPLVLTGVLVARGRTTVAKAGPSA
jgi:hypothetical protein